MRTLIIPSAILIPREMRSQFGNIPTVLYPLNNKVMLEHIYEQYLNVVDKIIVVANEKSNLVDDYAKWKKIPIDVVKTDRLLDLGYTIYCGLKSAVEFESDSVIVNFADTILGDQQFDIEEDCAYYSYENITEDWTFFTEQDGIVQSLSDKKKNEGKKIEGKVFVGTFMVTSVKEFYSILADCVLNKQSLDCDSFYSALIKYSYKHPINFRKTEQWFDVGHTEKYQEAKTGVAARVFNSIEIDDKRGILKKKSKNVDKFLGEINWYIKMPKKLQYLLPRVYDYSLDRYDPYIEMEYYGYHTLHELLVYGDLPLVRWQNILNKIKFIVDDMGKYTVMEDGNFSEPLKKIYVDKVESRLNELRNDDNFKAFFNNEIIINNMKYPNLNQILKIYIDNALKILINNFNGCFSIIHGDLCFSNILLEENHNFIRVIDPRGEFGGYDIYGDSRYEMAKLLHSIEGNYDFIIEDMFDINVMGTEIKINMPQKTEDILEILIDVFYSGDIKKAKEARLVESSLFLSMIPLHNDSLSRQYAMLAIGIQLLYKSLDLN